MSVAIAIRNGLAVRILVSTVRTVRSFGSQIGARASVDKVVLWRALNWVARYHNLGDCEVTEGLYAEGV